MLLIIIEFFIQNKHYRNSMQIDQTQKTEKSLNTDQDFLKSKKSFKGSTCYCELSSDDDPTQIQNDEDYDLKKILLKCELLENQNQKLTKKVCQLELEQRSYIQKILEMELSVATQSMTKTHSQKSSSKKLSIELSKKDRDELANRAQKILSKAEREEKKFIQAIKSNYKELFGIDSLKEIWMKHKEILGDWILS